MTENMDIAKRSLIQERHLKENIRMENRREKEFIFVITKVMMDNG